LLLWEPEGMRTGSVWLRGGSAALSDALCLVSFAQAFTVSC